MSILEILSQMPLPPYFFLRSAQNGLAASSKCFPHSALGSLAQISVMIKALLIFSKTCLQSSVFLIPSQIIRAPVIWGMASLYIQ